MNGTLVLYFLVAVMVLLWSGNYIAAKIALREFPALLLSGLRVALAALFMIPIYWRQHARGEDGHWNRSDVPLLIALGVFGVALNQLFFVIGIGRTTVAHSAIIIGMTPIFVLLIAGTLRMERITVFKVGGMAIAIAGVAILQVFRARETAGTGRPTVLGDIFSFLAALTFSIFTVMGKRVSLRHSAITVNTFAYVGGALMLAPIVFWQAGSISFRAITWSAWAGLIYMAAFSSVVCYLIYYYALRRISASRVAAFSYLQPLLAILMAVAILDERITAAVVAGGAIIFIGVFVTEHRWGGAA